MRLATFCAATLLLLVFPGCGGGGAQTQQNQPQFLPPPAPSQVNATPGTDFRYINLNWTLDYAQADWVQVETRVGTGAYSLALDHMAPIGPKTFVLPANFPEFGSITLRMRSVQHDLYSPYSNEATFTLGLAPASGIQATLSDAGIKVTWDHQSLVATAVKLERSEVQNVTVYDWKTIPGINLQDTSYLDTNFADVTRYSYRVTYSKDSVSSSTTTLAAPLWVPLVAPTNLQAVLESNGNVHLTWINRSTRGTNLTILRSNTIQFGSGIPPLVRPGDGQVEYIDRNPSPGFYTYGLTIQGDWNTWAYSTRVALYIPGPVGDIAFSHQLHSIKQIGSYWYIRAQRGKWGFMTPSEFAWEDGQGWNKTIPPLDSAAHVMAPGPLVDAQDKVHVITETPFSDFMRLQHLTYDGTTWLSEDVLDSKTSTPWYWGVRQAALDRNGFVHVMWPDADFKRMHYTTNASGAWKEETLPMPGGEWSTTGTGNYMALDPSGQPYMAAQTTSLLAHRGMDGTWALETIPTAGAVNGDLTLLALPNGVITALYSRYAGGPLMAITRSSGTWGTPVQISEWVDGVRAHVKMARSVDGTRVAVGAAGKGKILIATSTDGQTWKRTSIATSTYLPPEFTLGFNPFGKVWLDVLADSEGIDSEICYHMLFEETPTQ